MILWILACTSPGDKPLPVYDVEPVETGVATSIECPVFGDPVALGTVGPPGLREASGVVFVDNLLWAHNDSGSAAAVFALNRDGSRVGLVSVDASAVDIEDIAYLDGKLLLADIGDNFAVRSGIALHEVAVPDPADDEVAARTISLTWDLGARNAETLLADPISGDVLVVSKETDGNSAVGRITSPLPDVGMLETIAILPFGGELLPGDMLATGGDIAPDGTGVVIRTYLGAFVWPRIPGETWTETFTRPACPLQLETEPQGEAIAWSEEGLFTVSEGQHETVWFYPLLSP